MRTMKKMIAGIMAVLMTASVAGCGNAPENITSIKVNGQAQEAAAGQEDKKPASAQSTMPAAAGPVQGQDAASQGAPATQAQDQNKALLTDSEFRQFMSDFTTMINEYNDQAAYELLISIQGRGNEEQNAEIEEKLSAFTEGYIAHRETFDAFGQSKEEEEFRIKFDESGHLVFSSETGISPNAYSTSGTVYQLDLPGAVLYIDNYVNPQIPAPKETIFEYDENGRIVKETEYQVYDETIKRVIEYSYDEQGRIAAAVKKDSSGNSQTVDYNYVEENVFEASYSGDTSGSQSSDRMRWIDGNGSLTKWRELGGYNVIERNDKGQIVSLTSSYRTEFREIQEGEDLFKYIDEEEEYESMSMDPLFFPGSEDLEVNRHYEYSYDDNGMITQINLDDINGVLSKEYTYTPSMIYVRGTIYPWNK